MARLKSSKQRDVPRTVDEALRRYWKSGATLVPDYSGFAGWFAESDKAARSLPALPIHARANHPLLDLTTQLSEAAKEAGIVIDDEGVSLDPSKVKTTKEGALQLKYFNRAKLLISLIDQLSPRLRRLLRELMSPGPKERTQPTTQFDHRAAFFSAVEADDQHTAFKMLGRLREEDHDRGELEFLEALAWFHSNKLDQAIEHARRVSPGSIDWPRAFLLLLECHALGGDIDALIDDARSTPSFVFPQFFIPYICQLTIANSDNPDLARERAEDMLEECLYRSKPGVGDYQMWNRYSCKLAVQFVEYKRDMELRALALKEDVREQLDQADEEPLRYRQVDRALSLDVDLYDRLAGGPSDQASSEIIQRLINYGRSTPSDAIQAFVTQWRIEDRAIFLNNVLKSLGVLERSERPDARQLIIWAYQEALIAKHADADLLKQSMQGWSQMPQLAELTSSARIELIMRKLTPMGRLAFGSANSELEHAEKDANLWRDAGTISLGFMRIVELELNERLMLPTIAALDLQELEAKLASLKAENSQKSNDKKAIDFWDKMLRQIARVKRDGKGLELGSIEWLLSKVAVTDGIDQSLKVHFNSHLCNRLSQSGIDALRLGEISQLIGETVREKYRNPPAHCRYVGLETARECKRYVESALEKLISFTSTETPAQPTVH